MHHVNQLVDLRHHSLYLIIPFKFICEDRPHSPLEITGGHSRRGDLESILFLSHLNL